MGEDWLAVIDLQKGSAEIQTKPEPFLKKQQPVDLPHKQKGTQKCSTS